jgi:two-component system chemotaxis response regulator CheB
MNRLGTLSPFTCPACHGALWELSEGDLLRYRCHTGHAFSRDSLLAEQTSESERALYAAIRVMEEKARALRRLRSDSPGRFAGMRAEYEARAREMDDSVQVLHKLLASPDR